MSRSADTSQTRYSGSPPRFARPDQRSPHISAPLVWMSPQVITPRSVRGCGGRPSIPPDRRRCPFHRATAHVISANTPGRLVSGIIGSGRGRLCLSPSPSAYIAAAPVWMKPSSSMVPVSNAVLGTPPMKTNRARVWIERCSPVRLSSVTTAVGSPLPRAPRGSRSTSGRSRGGVGGSGRGDTGTWSCSGRRRGSARTPGKLARRGKPLPAVTETIARSPPDTRRHRGRRFGLGPSDRTIAAERR